MAEDKQIREVATNTPGQSGEPIVEHGIDAATAAAIVSAGAAVVSAGAAVYGATKQNNPASDPPPSPPNIELPPGVDRD